MGKLLQVISRRDLILSIVIMALSSLFFFFHVLYFEDILDDLTYRCIFTPGHPFMDSFGAEKVTSFADVLKSQCFEWHEHSGRFLLHTLSQMFTAVWGRPAFAICTTLVVFLIEIMLWLFLMERNSHYPVVWAVADSVLFAIYASPVMRIMAFSLNYIWPLVVVLPCIHMLKKTAENQQLSTPAAVGCILLAFITGCTQEVFNLPLVCSSFVLLCCLLIKRRKVSLLFVGVCVALWIGTATIVFAPGTIRRGDSLEPFMYLKSSIFMWIVYVIDMPVVWLTLLAFICVTIRYGMRALIRLCPFEMMCLVFATLMSLVVHTAVRSLSGFQIFCIIVLFACISRLLNDGVSEKYRRMLNKASILIFLIFSGIQIIQITKDYRYKSHNSAIVKEYIESPDGIVKYTPVDPKYKNGKYLYDFGYIRVSLCWNMLMQGTYGSLEKPLLLLTPDEITRFGEIGVNDSLRVQGDAGFYYLTDEIVVKPATGEETFEPLVVEYRNWQAGSSPLEKLLFDMRKARGADPETVTVTLNKDDQGPYRLIHSRFGDYIILLLESTPLTINKQ